jgi:hypothetical protein
MSNRLTAALCLAGAASLAVACSSWDDAQLFFPQTYEKSYHKLHDCRFGAHPAGEHIITWVNEAGRGAHEAKQYPYPTGTVFIKAQYTDKNCKEVSRYTVMHKAATGTADNSGDWQWQHVGPAGEVHECCQVDGCITCHAPFAGCDYVATGCNK